MEYSGGLNYLSVSKRGAHKASPVSIQAEISPGCPVHLLLLRRPCWWPHKPNRAVWLQPELEPPHCRSVSQHLPTAAWCQPGFTLQEATLGSWMGPCTHGGCSWPRGTFLVGCSEVGRFGPAQISLLSPASLTIRIKMAQKILLHKTNAFFPPCIFYRTTRTGLTHRNHVSSHPAWSWRWKAISRAATLPSAFQASLIDTLQ